MDVFVCLLDYSKSTTQIFFRVGIAWPEEEVIKFSEGFKSCSR